LGIEVVQGFPEINIPDLAVLYLNFQTGSLRDSKGVVPGCAKDNFVDSSLKTSITPPLPEGLCLLRWQTSGKKK
jgi:hypothetical protein